VSTIKEKNGSEWDACTIHLVPEYASKVALTYLWREKELKFGSRRQSKHRIGFSKRNSSHHHRLRPSSYLPSWALFAHTVRPILAAALMTTGRQSRLRAKRTIRRCWIFALVTWRFKGNSFCVSRTAQFFQKSGKDGKEYSLQVQATVSFNQTPDIHAGSSEFKRIVLQRGMQKCQSTHPAEIAFAAACKLHGEILPWYP